MGNGGHDTYSPRRVLSCSGMARLARIVIPGLPRHVTQRGDRREAIIFEEGATRWAMWTSIRTTSVSTMPKAASAPSPRRMGSAAPP